MTDRTAPNRFDELRARAERILNAESAEARTEVQRSVSELVEELQTHQIELELQNEELQATQQTLEASQARYRELFDFAPAAYLIFDLDGLVHDINVTGVELLRVARQRILNKPLWLYVHPDHRDRLARHLHTVAETDRSADCELQLQRKDGSQLWVHLHSAPHQNEDSDARVRTAMIDITERKELEQKLVAARERAVEATKAQRAFLSNMSHDIRTPLTSVIGFAEALDEVVGPGQPHEFAQAIKSSGRRLLNTLNSVLDYTRVQGHGGRVQLKPLDVAEQVSECVRVLQPQADTEAIQLTFEPGDLDAFARLHEDYFGRVLNNIIGNALKYTEEGAVTVRVLVHDEEVEVQVEDTGIGMEEDLLDRIFEPFLQADFGPWRQHEGVGLGLAITKRLVELMDGRITVASEVNEGSRFSVFFPRLVPEPGPPARDRSARDRAVRIQPFPRVSQASILVVEDNDDTRQLVQLFLKAASKVKTASTAEEAIRRLKAERFDGVLLDINLGEERTGIEVLQAMRQIDGYASTPVVAFTAYALPGDRERFLQSGFDSYVRKPFTKRQLLRALDEALEPVPQRASPSSEQ